MLNLVARNEDPWPDRWMPVGEGEHDKEPFDDWWLNHKSDFENLHEDIVRQWIYRHWKNSPLKFIDPSSLNWTIEVFSTVDLLKLVHLEWGQDKTDTPERDYEVFRPDKPNAPSTGKYWEDGTWIHPLIVLCAPNGVKGYDGAFPDKRYLVVEGSKRYRWLRALHSRGERTGPHQVFILSD